MLPEMLAFVATVPIPICETVEELRKMSTIFLKN
jgi:hypothetical protein